MTLSAGSQTEKDEYHTIAVICEKSKKQTNKQTNKQKQNQSYEHREQTEGSQRGRGGGLGKVGGGEWEVQASSGGMSKSWGCQAPHEECGH